MFGHIRAMFGPNRRVRRGLGLNLNIFYLNIFWLVVGPFRRVFGPFGNILARYSDFKKDIFKLYSFFSAVIIYYINTIFVSNFQIY